MENIKHDQLNNEILAAISAAIASFPARNGHKLVVRSIKRVPQVSPVWNITGRMEGIKRFK